MMTDKILSGLLRLVAGALGLSLTGSVMALAVGDRVENFRLMDHTGASHELHYFADAPAMVLMTHSTSCPTLSDSLQSLASIHQQFAPEGAEIMLINSDLRDNRSSVQAAADEAGIELPILLDTTQIIGENLLAATAGETLVINPSTWTLAYRGDADGARQAVAQLVQGDTVTAVSAPTQNLAAWWTFQSWPVAPSTKPFPTQTPLRPC
jgi:peroxiredoxin